MYAIVDIAGQQLKVEEKQKVFVNRLEGEEGSTVDFDKVLLVDNDGKIQVGTPTVSNTIVTATIIAHLRGETKLVFKKKRRKGYQKLNGHRQYLSQIQIDRIGEGTARPKVSTKRTVAPKAEADGEVVTQVKKAVKTEPKVAKSAGPKKETPVKAKAPKATAAKKETSPKPKAVKAAAEKKSAPKAKKKPAKTAKGKTKE